MSEIILFNKPYGVLCQFTAEKGISTLADFIKVPDFYAAGRLDKNSEGLLLLTDNGQIQNQITSPKRKKKKYYWVQVEGEVEDNHLNPLRMGLQTSECQFLPAEVNIIDEPERLWERTPPIRFRKNIPTTWLEIILQEGKNHQIRKMTAHIGYPTLRLVRYRIDCWTLGLLQPGDHRIEVYPKLIKRH